MCPTDPPRPCSPAWCCPRWPSGDRRQRPAAITDRCTDRRRFTSWPVPDERLQHLANVAAEHGVHAVPLLDVSERFRAGCSVHGLSSNRSPTRAMPGSRNNGWSAAIGRHPLAVPPREVSTAGGARPGRFSAGLLEDPLRVIEGSDGLVILCSGPTTWPAWLRAGEGLSALWLVATSQGLSVVPLSQVVELPETRARSSATCCGSLAHPLILARIGWQPISRSQLPRTSRRPVDDILDLR